MSQWQPIETAPANDYILIWGGGWRHTFVGRYIGDGFVLVDGADADATQTQYFATHWMSLPDSPTSVDPDMTRAGDKHIKLCRGLNCSDLILWAKHVKKDGSIGNVAPLVKAKAGETPNIMAWYDEKADQWFYKIKGTKSEVRGIAEYVNHHMNCESKGQFKTNPSEQEQSQAAIK